MLPPLKAKQFDTENSEIFAIILFSPFPESFISAKLGTLTKWRTTLPLTDVGKSCTSHKFLT